jgi:hypothetical protein
MARGRLEAFPGRIRAFRRRAQRRRINMSMRRINMKEWDITETEIPTFSRARGVFFARSTRSSRHYVAIAAYERGYAAIELGEKEIAFRGWREIYLPERKAIARLRGRRGWQERYFFACDRSVGEILPDGVVFREEVSLFEEGGPSWKIVISRGDPALRSPEGDRRLEGFGDLYLFQPAPGADLDAILYLGSRQDEGWEWHRISPTGDPLRQRLPVGGQIEVGANRVAVLREAPYTGFAYVAGWGWNTAHLAAQKAWAMGLSPAGDRMVLLRREEEGWVWDFRKIRRSQVVQGPILPAFSKEFPGRVEDRPWEWIYRISPDLRWIFIAAPGRVLVARIPEPARGGDPGGQVLDPRRILPVR